LNFDEKEPWTYIMDHSSKRLPIPIKQIESEEGAVSTGCISGIAISAKPSRSVTATVLRIMNCHIEKHKTYSGPQPKDPTLKQTNKNKKLTLMPGVKSQSRRITVTGVSIQDVPATYIITGLLKHEFPVIGEYRIRVACIYIRTIVRKPMTPVLIHTYFRNLCGFEGSARIPLHCSSSSPQKSFVWRPTQETAEHRTGIWETFYIRISVSE
jgi:hypothetical protein